MAHSNKELRKKLRGNMTKNQAMKSQRAGQQAERLRQVLAHQRFLEEERMNGTVKPGVVVKTHKINMWPSTIERRKVSLKHLLEQLISEVKPVKGNKNSILFHNTHLTEQDVVRIGAEIKVLKEHI